MYLHDFGLITKHLLLQLIKKKTGTGFYKHVHARQIGRFPWLEFIPRTGKVVIYKLPTLRLGDWFRKVVKSRQDFL